MIRARFKSLVQTLVRGHLYASLYAVVRAGQLRGKDAGQSLYASLYGVVHRPCTRATY
jgi:hypothetical protein